MLTSIVAALHLIALVLGAGSVWMRGRYLRPPLEKARLALLFKADNMWGAAAALWIITGLWRLLVGLDKPFSWYLHYPVFHLKLSLFVLVLLLEIWPMATLIRWRIQVRRGQEPDLAAATKLYWLNHAETAIVVLIVFVATAAARGIGYRAH